MSSSQPYVSVIIPTYKEWDKLRQCLLALNKQTYPKDKFEIIVINNDPDGVVPENIVLQENYKFLTEAKPGSYSARNTGLKVAKGEIIGFTDSDCIADKNWIKNAVDYLIENKNYSRVAGPLKIIQKSNKPTIIEKYNQLYSFPQEWLINNGGGSVTGNLFVYKYVVDAIGGFDDTLMSMGDKYWGMKAEAAGFKIAYVENVFVYHPSRSFQELIKKEKRHAGGVKDSLPNSQIMLYLKFLYELRPRLSGLRFMLGGGKDKRLIDRIMIPLLRHYLITVRRYEGIKIKTGKHKPSRV